MQNGYPYPKMSEDCLHLNVFVPDSSTCSNSSDIAVIVFINGGGFVSGNAEMYGPQLLLNECVILVTLNSRLDIFGFLPLALPEYSGNMGLKDQQEALKWIKRFIFAFGGNAKRVTLMGHSSGGAVVAFHRLNLISRKYFNQTFIASGGAFSTYALSDINNKTDFIVDIAKKQNITITNFKQLIKYLQNVSAEFLLENSPRREVRDYIRHISIDAPWKPCIERKLL